ncbi:MAG TPA: type II secretion system protein GspC [Steroidobacteraceae bacterium]|jgi:general secretion pathway protein C|nr:type II secretion system protein GspC [Steroidobacteraceae bacterium]
MTANFWNPSAGGGDWRSVMRTRAPQVATFVLALALAAQLAFIVVAMTGRSRQAGAAPITASAPVAQLDIGGLVNAHLFGNAAAQPSADAANAPPSSMPLVLAGVLATADPKLGMAIIGESAQAAKVVSVGQQVPGGAQLNSVYNDRVIIDRGGALESVLLPRRNGALGPPPPPVAVASANSNEAMVERMRKLVTDDPGLIGQIMRPQPVFAGGQMRGFRLYPGANRQAFARMGLRAGDMVTAINGTPLNDKDRAQEIFGTLASSTDARITITRNGRQQDLVLNIAQVTAEAEQLGNGGDGNNPSEPPAAEPVPTNEQ